MTTMHLKLLFVLMLCVLMVYQNNLSFNVTKAKNFIDGYCSVRKLKDIEKINIKTLSQGAALRFLLTRVFDAINTVEGAIVKVKDPIEYLKRLEFHKNSRNFEDYFLLMKYTNLYRWCLFRKPRSRGLGSSNF